MSRFFVLAAVTFAFSVPPFAHGQAGPVVTVDAVSKIIDSPIIAKVFDWLTREKTPLQQAQPKIRSLYKDLLDCREYRESLKASVQDRINLLQTNTASQNDLAANKDEIYHNNEQLETALHNLQKDFERLHVDLDVYNQQLPDDVQDYLDPKGRVVHTVQQAAGPSNSGTVRGISNSVWSLDRLDDLKLIQIRLQANDRRIRKAITDMRVLTRKLYPNFGEMLPGASVAAASHNR